MAAAGVVRRALTLVAPTAPALLLSCTLRLLNNLAFDSKLRAQMVQAGFVQRLGEVLTQQSASAVSRPQFTSGQGAEPAGSQLQPLALGLMYLASMEEGGRTAAAVLQVLPT